MFGFTLPKPTGKKNLMIGAIVLIFGLLTIYIYRTYAVPLIYKKNKPNLEHNTEMGINKQTVEVLFFYADWCPHCKKAKPHWNNLKNSEKVGQGRRVNNYSIVYTEVDCTDDKASGIQEKLSKFKVDGFPTIKMVKGTEVIEFDAKPEFEILEGFVLQTLNN